MGLMLINLSEPINNMAIKLVVFSIVVIILYLFPFLITKAIFKSNQVANFVSIFVLLGYLYLDHQKGQFLEWFFTMGYLKF